MSDKKYPQKKVEAIAQLEELVNKSSSIFLADYSGMTVEKMTMLRDKLFDNNIEVLVAKNTLLRKALNNNGIDKLDDYLKGPNLFAFGAKDPVAPAKIIFDFAKENERPALKSCLFEGILYGPDKIEAIKDLPTRDEALAALLGQMQAPLSHFVGVLNEIIRSFLAILDAIIAEKGGAPSNA